MEILKAKLEELQKEARALNDKPDATLEEIKSKQEEIKVVKAKIEAQVALDEIDARRQAPINRPVVTSPINDKPFASFGEQLRAVIAAGTPGGSIDSRLGVLNAASGMGEAVPSDGGFLVQQDFVSELLKKTYETGVLASRCRKIPIGAGASGLKINTIDETSRANGSRWGGVQAYWENEADTTTASKPKLARIEMNLEKLIGICYATEELLQDASALESVIMQGFSEEFGFKIDDGIINGTGAGQLLGIMNGGCLVPVAKENGQAASTVIFENIVKMWSRAYGKSRSNAAWLINQDIEPQLFGMSLAVGTGGVPVYLPANGLSGSPYGTLFGRPVIPVEQCATLGTVGDIILADLSQYLLIDKGGINAAQSIHVRFLYGENTFRFTYRANGQPIWKSALTPFKGSNTQSPFVALATRS